MKLYNFARLITKYSVPFRLVRKSAGAWVSGKWVEGGETTVVDMQGAIVPMPESKVTHSGGAYTAQDRQLVMIAPIEGWKDCQVQYKRNLYNIEQETDHGDYGDVAVYVLKWVSLFDGEVNGDD